MSAIQLDGKVAVTTGGPRVQPARRGVARALRRYEYLLRRSSQVWKIGRKRIILLNDLIPTVIDFYNL